MEIGEGDLLVGVCQDSQSMIQENTVGNEKKQSTWGERAVGFFHPSTLLWSKEQDGEATNGPESKAAAGQREVGVGHL